MRHSKELEDNQQDTAIGPLASSTTRIELYELHERIHEEYRRGTTEGVMKCLGHF